jgi:methylmalonyl-CoA mutase cobalamin-binding subunit
MVDVVVIVTGAHRAQIEQVTDALRAAGLHVTQVLGQLGQVVGAVAEDRLDALRAVDGVQSVDRSGKVRIAPPDSSVQ